jgi:hypothetical protein
MNSKLEFASLHRHNTPFICQKHSLLRTLSFFFLIFKIKIPSIIFGYFSMIVKLDMI